MIIGHQKQWHFFEEIAKSGRIPHALLFSGQEKLGKKTIAIEFIKLFFGKNIFSHPDFTLIEPINNEIQISQIRDLNWKLSLKPFIAPLKAAIIDRAHLMNQEAQNCFLKTLEEPKGRAVLILITEYPETLFSTILSRCENFKFYPVPGKEIKDFLKNREISEEKIEEIINISQGKPGMAVDFISNEEKLNNQKQIMKDLNRIIDSDLAYRFQYAKDLSEGGNIKETLENWLAYFRSALINSVKFPKGESIFPQYSFLKIKNIVQQILTINFIINTTNVNKRLALETLMLDL